MIHQNLKTINVLLLLNTGLLLLNTGSQFAAPTLQHHSS
jgi:hypothetical protein